MVPDFFFLRWYGADNPELLEMTILLIIHLIEYAKYSLKRIFNENIISCWLFFVYINALVLYLPRQTYKCISIPILFKYNP